MSISGCRTAARGGVASHRPLRGRSRRGDLRSVAQRCGADWPTHRRDAVKLAVSADERTHLVDVVLDELRNRGHDARYIGPEAGEERDWPEVSAAAAKLVVAGEVEQAIVMCWT